MGSEQTLIPQTGLESNGAADKTSSTSVEALGDFPQKPTSRTESEQSEQDGLAGAQHPSFQGETRNKKRGSKGGKSIAQRGPTALPRGRGTGFEEYFADPPMTPQEAAEEKQEIYDPDISFEERMQSCIQRFRARRRLQGDQTLYFNEYLFLGGIDAQPAAFTGQDPRDLKDLTPAQRQEATATDVVHGRTTGSDRFYNGDRDHWSVDFLGVAAGFLSMTVPQLTGLEAKPMEKAISVVESFLRYVLQHDVCPEYTDDVSAALQLCAVARLEWPAVDEVRMAFPGHFNLAAAELFGRQGCDFWTRHGLSRPTDFDARRVFYAALALLEEPGKFDRMCEDTPVISREVYGAFEICAIDRPDAEIVRRFRSFTLGGESASMMTIGKATLRETTIQDEWDHPDLPTSLEDGEAISLYLDDAILVKLRLGMKMHLTVCELGGRDGIWFVETAGMILPSFYTFLPQELMRYFKPPREDDRPAPSVHDPETNCETAC